jgi:hypothetical protein
MEKLAARREVMNMQRGFTKIRRTDLARLETLDITTPRHGSTAIDSFTGESVDRWRQEKRPDTDTQVTQRVVELDALGRLRSDFAVLASVRLSA